MTKEEIIEEDEELEEILDEEDQEKDPPTLVDFSSEDQVKKTPSKRVKPIDLDTFQEFLQMPEESVSPVLEQVEQAPETTNLEQWASTGSPTQTQNSNNQDDPTKYSVGNKEEDTKKYLASSATMTSETQRFDPTTLGRDKTKIQEADFVHSETQDSKPSLETYTIPDKVDTDQLGRDKSPQTRETDRKKMDYEPLH